MTGQAEQITKSIQDLTVRVGADVMRSLLRYYELLQRLTDGELDEAAAREMYVRFVRDETERYLRGAAAMSSSYYDALLELASTYRAPFFEQAARQPRPSAGAPVQSPDCRRVVELRGSLGAEAASAIEVRNPCGGSEEVTFVVSEFSGPTGLPAFRPPLRLQPPRFVLERGESQLVSVHLPLVAEVFASNERYVATLTVQKRDVEHLTIEVIVAPPNEAPDSSTPASSGRAG